MKRTLMMIAALAALITVSHDDLSAQSKFGKFVKKAAKAVSETTSAFSDNSSGSSALSGSSSAGEETAGPVITTPGKAITAKFYEATVSGEDMLVDFTIYNSGEAISPYRIREVMAKDERGKAYTTYFRAPGYPNYVSSANVPIGKDDAIYIEMIVKGAARQKVNIEFECQNVGIDKTNSPDGKFYLKGVSVAD